MRYFWEIEQLIVENGLATEGCSEADIASLQNRLPHPIPSAYHEFLLLFGRNPAGFLAGSEIEFIYLQNMREEANEILLRNDARVLADDEFVFFVHQNYSFYTVKLDADDPDIFLSIEGGEEFEQQIGHGLFSVFIKQQFQSHLAGGYLKRHP